MTSVSAIMIVRDEAQNLGDCFKSLMFKVDELNIVDTGSTDGTLDLSRYGFVPPETHVYLGKWDDDFSAPRNIGIDMSQGDYLIYIDADERLEGTPRDIDLTEVCYGVTVRSSWNPTHDNLSVQPRLFRRDQGIRFYGRIHEQPLLPDGSDLPLTKQNAIELFHGGYDHRTSTERLVTKAARNHSILLKGLNDEPGWRPGPSIVTLKLPWLATSK